MDAAEKGEVIDLSDKSRKFWLNFAAAAHMIVKYPTSCSIWSELRFPVLSHKLSSLPVHQVVKSFSLNPAQDRAHVDTNGGLKCSQMLNSQLWIFNIAQIERRKLRFCLIQYKIWYTIILINPQCNAS